MDEEFDIAAEIQEFTREVVHGYAMEKSAARVDLQLGQLDPAVLRGNLPRFHRMYFNLIMNAVDALSHQKVGIIRTTALADGDRVVMQVSDDGLGMTPQKREQLLTEKESLDGELHSLGFVFVRQTVEEFQGEISVDSELGEGTTITIRFPCLPGRTVTPRGPSHHREHGLRPHPEEPRGEPLVTPGGAHASSGAAPAEGAEPGRGGRKSVPYGKLVLEDYRPRGPSPAAPSSPSRSPRETRSTASPTSPTSATGTSPTRTSRRCSSSRRSAAAWRRTSSGTRS
jgi:hypothetical protein